jgi:hypothetical protein
MKYEAISIIITAKGLIIAKAKFELLDLMEFIAHRNFVSKGISE